MYCSDEIPTTNFSRGGTQTKSFEELLYSPSSVGTLQQDSIPFSAVHNLFSVSAFLGNTLIIVTLEKESSLHPLSKLLYHFLETTDLLVGLVYQPLITFYWMSVPHEHWSLPPRI